MSGLKVSSAWYACNSSYTYCTPAQVGLKILNFLDSLKLMLGSEYNMNVVKEFKGTESFLDMEESSRKCQIIDSLQIKCVNLKFYVNEIV